MAARLELAHQLADVNFGAAADERHLRFADQDVFHVQQSIVVGDDRSSPIDDDLAATTGRRASSRPGFQPRLRRSG